MCSLPSLLLVSWISMVSWQSHWPVDTVDILNAFYESIVVKVQNVMFWPQWCLLRWQHNPASKEWGWVAMMICDIQQISIRIFKCLASLCSPTKSQTHLYGAYPKIVAILDPGLRAVASHLRGICVFWGYHYFGSIPYTCLHTCNTIIVIYIHTYIYILGGGFKYFFYFHPYLGTNIFQMGGSTTN